MLIVLDNSSALLFVFRHTRLKLFTIQGTWIAKMPTYFPLKCFLGGKFDSWFVTTVAYQFKVDRYESLKKRWIKRIDRRIIRKNFSLPILDLTCSGGLFLSSIERRCECIFHSTHHDCTGFFKYREIQYFLQAGVRLTYYFLFIRAASPQSHWDKTSRSHPCWCPLRIVLYPRTSC